MKEVKIPPAIKVMAFLVLMAVISFAMSILILVGD